MVYTHIGMCKDAPSRDPQMLWFMAFLLLAIFLWWTLGQKKTKKNTNGSIKYLDPKFNSHIVVVVTYVVCDRFYCAYLKIEKYLWHFCVFTAHPHNLRTMGLAALGQNTGNDLNTHESEDV